MPALNFQAQFAPKVEAGEKLQTIRAYRKDGRDPKPGDTLYLYTGMRTKACRKLGEATCSWVEPIRIGRHGFWICRGEWEVKNRSPNLHYIGHSAAGNQLAKIDGFRDYEEMADWFDSTHGLPFSGLLIRWARVEPGEKRERGVA